MTAGALNRAAFFLVAIAADLVKKITSLRRRFADFVTT